MDDMNLSIGSSGIAELTFDVKDEKVNVLSARVMTELGRMLDEIFENKNIKILMFKSAKRDVFIAGADLREIAGIKNNEDAGEKSAAGQGIFNRIERLPFPTISVINGACLGGGLELALSCSYRIVSDGKKVRLGLPETTLGLIPGFGGTVRLPRLVGLSRGLEMILSGKSVDGLKSYKIKLSDAIYPEAFIDENAEKFAVKIIEDEVFRKNLERKRKKSGGNFLLEGNPAGRALFFYAAKKNLMKKTRGFYPAVLTAFETIKKSYTKRPAKALMIENRNFSRISTNPVSKNMIRLYFMNEELKRANRIQKPDDAADKGRPVKYAGVLGAGKMGGGIAWLLSNSLIDTRMKDISWEFILAGYKAVREMYSGLKTVGKLDDREIGLRMNKISAGIDYSGLSSSDLVIEAIIEDREIKKKTLNEVESVVRDDAIIATNTSSISVSELAEGMKHPERFIGFHFFNPVNRMPLVEIVRGKNTSEAVVRKMVELAETLNKMPVVVNDCNGFLVNRILTAYLNEALLMMEEGADFFKIDRAIYGFGFPMGPFTLLDEIGIKVGYKVAKNLAAAYPGRFEEGKISARTMEESGLNGKVSGRGFFIYDGNKKTVNKEIYGILSRNRIVKNENIDDSEIIERCMLRMINEASACIEENVINSAGILDLALIYGIGFPPFLGGLLRYADEMGVGKIMSGLEKYYRLYGGRFKPARLLEDKKKNGRGFY